MEKKAAILLSGGVDSAVAAFLMKERGFGVEGFFMRTDFFTEEAEKSAKKIADFLDIKLNILDATKEFSEIVIQNFESEFSKLRTPNPCALCNKKIKFGFLFNEIRKREFETIVSGHYIAKYQIGGALPLEEGQEYKLRKAKDNKKDQTYFLYNLTQDQLKYLEFPLGGLTKQEVFEIAQKNNLPISISESQDICFLRGDHNKYLQQHLKLENGPIVDKTGKIVGEHFGLPLYSIGQRRWIKIGGTGPYYVLRIDAKNNSLVVSNRFDDPEFYDDKFEVSKASWVSGQEFKQNLEQENLSVKIRYLHPDILVKKLEKMGEGRYKVILKKPQRAIIAGQSAVFYQGEELLGGGIIEH
ncbi:MAG: tRNA 2-thiouridine(34) synthase MnmA [bacterium]